MTDPNVPEPYSQEPWVDPTGGSAGGATGGATSEAQLRDQIARRTAQVISRVVSVLARPTKLMLLAPAVPSVALILLGLAADRPVTILTSVVGALGLLLAARMAWLRARIVWAAKDENALATELSQALDVAGHLAHARQQVLGQMESTASAATSVADARRALADLGLTGGIKDRIANLTRVTPFLPGALRSTFLTGTFCFTAAGFLSLFAVILAFLLLIGVL